MDLEVVIIYLFFLLPDLVNFSHIDGKTPLHFAVQTGFHFGIFNNDAGLNTVSLLLNSGADVLITDNDGFKASDMIISDGFKESIRFTLLIHGGLFYCF